MPFLFLLLLLLLRSRSAESSRACNDSSVLRVVPDPPCLWMAATATLNCSSRRLSALPQRGKVPAAQVRNLLLTNNFLSHLPCRSFALWPRLEFADLSRNRLISLHPHALSGVGLRHLDLSRNRLDARAVAGLQSRAAAEVDVRHNRIVAVGKTEFRHLKRLRARLWPNPVRCSCSNQPLLLWAARQEGLSRAQLAGRCPAPGRNQTYAEFLEDPQCLNSTKFRLFVTTTIVAATVLLIVVATYAWKKRRYEQHMRRPSTILFKREPGFFALTASTARNSIASRCFILYEQMAGLGRSPRPSLKSAGSRLSQRCPPSPRPSIKSTVSKFSLRSSSPQPEEV